MLDLDRTALLYLHGNENLFKNITEELGLNTIDREIRRFPDGETYVRIDSDVEGENVFIFSSMDRPDSKFLPLIYTAQTLLEEGAKSVGLIAPYLAYMRQDKQFNPGEAVTSRQFARLIDQYFDSLVTIDPHLHRYKSLDELYNLSTEVLHADPALAEWIGKNVNDPFLIGPDSESEQWVSKVAQKIDAPYNVLTKVRHGDRNIEITFKDPEKRRDRTPVLVDDIISTAGTMIKATQTLLNNNYPAPICVGVHAIFAGNAYEDLKEAGAKKVLTCNTVKHSSNTINLSDIITKTFQ